ncbi:hypothetical protein C6A85_01810, partial [Mycobacterium sp. ITM-2017-0098]
QRHFPEIPEGAFFVRYANPYANAHAFAVARRCPFAAAAASVLVFLERRDEPGEIQVSYAF